MRKIIFILSFIIFYSLSFAVFADEEKKESKIYMINLFYGGELSGEAFLQVGSPDKRGNCRYIYLVFLDKRRTEINPKFLRINGVKIKEAKQIIEIPEAWELTFVKPIKFGLKKEQIKYVSKNPKVRVEIKKFIPKKISQQTF